MKAAPRTVLLALVAISGILSAAPLRAQDAVLAQPVLTLEQMEDFLLNAKILKTREISKGITGSQRATMSNGQVTHDAQIQTVDIAQFVFTPQRGPTELNFKDSYRYNVAGYRLARLLGLHNVPVSVDRRIERERAAVTWWIDDVMMDEAERLKRVKEKTVPAQWRSTKTAGYIHVMRVFDELIANTDRNTGNQLWSSDGKLWLIDHTRAFRLQTALRTPRLLERCERALFGALRKLSVDNLTAAVDQSLNKNEVEALLARRDLIVKLFEDKIAARGENSILYDLER